MQRIAGAWGVQSFGEGERGEEREEMREMGKRVKAGIGRGGR